MYDYKKLHVWLMVISFLVLHFFGTHAFFRKYDFFSLNRGGLYVDLHKQYENILKDIFSDFYSTNLDFEDSMLSSSENRHTNFLRDVMKGITRKNNVMTQEILVCDNRIDKIDEKYSECLCRPNVNIEDNRLISVV